MVHGLAVEVVDDLNNLAAVRARLGTTAHFCKVVAQNVSVKWLFFCKVVIMNGLAVEVVDDLNNLAAVPPQTLDPKPSTLNLKDSGESVHTLSKFVPRPRMAA